MYDNPTKDTWRGWAWNQVSRRSRSGVVMVLCGDVAGDVPHADRRGRSMVGVDISDSAVKRFRGKKHVAIQDDVRNQIHLMKPTAVILDMLGGITRRSFFGVMAAATVQCECAVWNGLRGRDERGASLSKAAIEGGVTVPEFDRRGRLAKRSFVGSHRGKIAISSLAARLWPQKNLDYDEWYEMFMRHAKPTFYTYRSQDSGHYYDSVAFNCLRGFVTLPVDGYIDDACKKLTQKMPRKSRRKAAAAKAILTMKSRR